MGRKCGFSSFRISFVVGFVCYRQSKGQHGLVLTAAPTTGAQVNRTSWAQPQHEQVLGGFLATAGSQSLKFWNCPSTRRKTMNSNQFLLLL